MSINQWEKILRTEYRYIAQFALATEKSDRIRFRDPKLPGMYCHNFTYIKEPLTKESLYQVFSEELNIRKEENADFLRIEIPGKADKELLSLLPDSVETESFDFMIITPEKYTALSGNPDCVIRKAVTESILKDGELVDITANEPEMGAFARDRIRRKLEVYRDDSKGVDFYVCYSGGDPIGNCELFSDPPEKPEIVKIEDFDILPRFQRKGYGTAVLKNLLKESRKAELAYLITESGDTAKEMYQKCGFCKIGVKTELFYPIKQ